MRDGACGVKRRWIRRAAWGCAGAGAALAAAYVASVWYELRVQGCTGTATMGAGVGAGAAGVVWYGSAIARAGRAWHLEGAGAVQWRPQVEHLAATRRMPEFWAVV